MHAKADRGEISQETISHWDVETKKKGFKGAKGRTKGKELKEWAKH